MMASSEDVHGTSYEDHEVGEAPSSPPYSVDDSTDADPRYSRAAPSPITYSRLPNWSLPHLSAPPTRLPPGMPHTSSPMRPQVLSREWDSDLSAEENMAIWQADLSMYYDKRGAHHALIEQAWNDLARTTQQDTTQALWESYEHRYIGVQERIAADGGSEADNIDMELLDTLTDRRGRGRRDSSSSEELVHDAPSSEALRAAEEKYTEPQPELIDPETGQLRGYIPIGERREAMLEEAHKRVWTIIARRDIPRVYRMVQASAANRAMYWRRLSSVVQREAKRGAARNNKSAKDMQLRARKVMRELLLYWKRNEREERDLRKKAEKEALEKAKKEEEMREAKRQARKLNFLITQTELYSHFVGSKLKTSEAEESEETSGAGGAQPDAPQIEAPPATGTEALGDIDFDDDDESNLRAHAARNATEAVQAARDKAQAFDKSVADERRRLQEAGEGAAGDDLDFLNPSSMGATEVEQPKMLTCALKPYQLKGLSWLANLYEQGINGILADEMGLGKTVQSIALMAYLAEVHNIWGPFLVIAPASTLHNWQQEITRFVPALKALPYWGNVKDRAVLRKFWNRKQISYDRNAPFHVLVTSYQLVVTDEKYFQRVKWQYMVLDEAQAIKSSSSNRWKTLLSFNCRNRLLLTGTPVQNSMQELWALLHFIMPSLFDSHDEFSEWFSKDIESHAENKGTLNEHQLRRLHMILKPFMLRRIKKNVQNELGDKIEIDLYTDLSARQKMLYKGLRAHVSVAELMDKVNTSDESGLKSLMNLVMQFRKVCNHPELFERADVRAPFIFGTFAESPPIVRDNDMLSCPDSLRSMLDVTLARSFVRDGLLLSVPGEKSRAGFDTRYMDGLLNIWRAPHVASATEGTDAFSFLPLLRISPRQVEKAYHGGIAELTDVAAAEHRRAEASSLLYDDDFSVSALRPLGDVRRPVPFAYERPAPELPPLGRIAEYALEDRFVDSTLRAVIPPAVAAKPRLDANYQPHVQRMMRFDRDLNVSAALFGLPGAMAEDPAAVDLMHAQVPHVPPRGLVSQSQGVTLWKSPMQVPQMDKLIVDSSKMARLDSLLRELKAGGHRVLIYFQMTKMIDLMEEYLIYRQYKYLRLDGASKISDRRDMVTDWQTRPELFIFLLSTRAGGLGINLTAADTVIFYDHDWNPSNDSQAMDRAHRLGQTKQVTVYRLITKGTIDERIVKLARNKKEVQDIVVGNKAYSETGMAKPQEIVSLLLDDDELAESMLRRKQADEAQLAQGKAESARAMHARRKLKEANGTASTPPPQQASWALEDDEDDFFGARPPRPEEEETVEESPSKKRRAPAGDSSRRPRKSRAKDADVE
ncbi:Putative DNA helicase ino80 [Malassezia cuniculi]|uniref:Chromatin-remodeling ATPase INO80 n=1 Tax=Malassezia cuniculi TaxID=948313 RepID=A0AAF0ESJ5_9BASI|nr:Putative DNA helicase ino80 [Malassezia cuniculi]